MIKQLVICLAAVAGYVQADCYPGDVAYTKIVQDIYHGVTSDNIRLASYGDGNSAISRHTLCNTLVTHHNYEKSHPTQSETNRDFLGNLYISTLRCTNALKATTVYLAGSSGQGITLGVGTLLGRYLPMVLSGLLRLTSRAQRMCSSQ